MTDATKKQKVAEYSSAKRNREEEGVAEGHGEEGNAHWHADDPKTTVPEGHIGANGFMNVYHQPLQPPSAVVPAALISADTHDQARVSRTLKEVSENFLAEFCCKDEETEIDVDDAAQVICVPKRRIYDVVNVLSGLGLVVKSQKGR